jgi:hypothetical protein
MKMQTNPSTFYSFLITTAMEATKLANGGIVYWLPQELPLGFHTQGCNCTYCSSTHVQEMTQTRECK